MLTTLSYKSCWQAPGYRSPEFVLVDETGKEYYLQIKPADLQRIIYECADAAKQIGIDPPIDWDSHPTQVVWPQITPWKAGPPKAASPVKDHQS